MSEVKVVVLTALGVSEWWIVDEEELPIMGPFETSEIAHDYLEAVFNRGELEDED